MLNKQLLFRLGFFAVITMIGILSRSATMRTLLGATIMLCSLLIIFLTYKKPKHIKGKATITSVKKDEHESQYKLRFKPEDCESVPAGYENEAFYVETPRYEDSFKKGEIGDVVDAGWYEFTSKVDGTRQIKGIICENGFYIYARKFVKFYFLVLAAGSGLLTWGVVSMLMK